MVRDNLLPGLRVCQGRVPPPFASRKFEAEPLLVVPCFVFRPKPDVRRNDIDGAVARDQPLALRDGEHNKAATVRTLVAVRLCTGAPQGRHAECRPRGADVIEGHVNRRETALSIGVSSWEPTLDGLVEVAGKHDFQHKSRIRRSMAIQTDLCLAHTLSMWMLAIVKYEHARSGALRNLLVTIIPSTAHEA